MQSNDPTQPTATLELKGIVKTIIDILPQDQVFFNALKGESAHQEVTIVNNEEKPLTITKVEGEPKYFKTELQTIEKGKKYKLVATLNTETPVGRFDETVKLHTNHPKFEVIPIKFNVFVRSVVSAYPPTVHFGTVKLENVGTGPAHQSSRSVIIRKLKEDKEFKVEKVTSEAAFLKLSFEPATLGASSAYKITITLVKDKLQKDSPLNSSISVITNDKEVPELKIPVMGKVL